MGNQSTYKPLRKILTPGGFKVVVDDELGCFFFNMGEGQFNYVEGRPDVDDAKEQKFLTGWVLDRWTKEGRILNGQSYKKRLKLAFRKP